MRASSKYSIILNKSSILEYDSPWQTFTKIIIIHGHWMFFKNFVISDFREEGRERKTERNINVREKHRLDAFVHTPAGDGPATEAGALTGN